MTKEELKKEAEEYYEDETEGTFQICEDCYWFADAVQTAYIDSAETREKRIEELERKLEQTENDLADYQFNYPTIKELEKENADLKEEINKIAFARGNLEDENAELKSENQKWKDEWQEQVQKATDEGYARTLQTIQLTKAKELLKQFLNAKNGEDTYKAEWETEQFLKDSEVEKGKGGKDVL